MKTVPLTGKHAAGRVALVDDEDYDRVMCHSWHVDANPRHPNLFYARAKVGGRITRMHIFITGCTGMDHIDRNGLNNQRSNLRGATSSQNQANRRMQGNNTSGYRGVHWNRQIGTWTAYIGSKKTRHHLGCFATAEEAARVRDAAAFETWGEYAILNFPKGD